MLVDLAMRPCGSYTLSNHYDNRPNPAFVPYLFQCPEMLNFLTWRTGSVMIFFSRNFPFSMVNYLTSMLIMPRFLARLRQLWSSPADHEREEGNDDYKTLEQAPSPIIPAFY